MTKSEIRATKEIMNIPRVLLVIALLFSGYSAAAYAFSDAGCQKGEIVSGGMP
jgi:hypothetical protein